MSKNKHHKEYTAPVAEETTAEVINEGTISGDILAATDVLEEEKTEENKTTPGKVTNCHRLNIRKEPSLDSEILRVISEGDEVKILDESTANGWLPVLLSDGTKGYTMKDYIN